MAKIGIDFGTSYSTVAYKNPKTGLAESIRINGSEKIPTILYYSPDGGDPMVGQEAFEIFELCNDNEDKEEVAIHLSGIFSDLKRSMNKEEKLYLPDGRSLSYPEIIGQFFSFIKKEVETTIFNGEKVTDVCLTHPVDFPTYKKEILIEAAQIAGFTKIKLLMEPVAASMGFSNTTNNANQSVLIYDFGGGTFDLAFVKFDATGDNPITLPPKGDANCGGENIDRLLYDAWDKIVLQESGEHISTIPDSVDYPFIKAVCMKRKEYLSNYFKKMSKWDLKANVRGRVYTMPMTKDAWNNMIYPIVEKTILLTKQMLEDIRNEKFTITKVILIGGSSQIPLVTELLTPILPVEPHKVADSDIAVAKGAALFVEEDIVPEHIFFCRKCGHKMTNRIKICPECYTPNIRYNYKYDGENIVASTNKKTIVQQEEMQSISPCFCNKCGNKITTNMKFCNKCGSLNSKFYR